MPDTFIADVEQWFADELAGLEHNGQKVFRTADVFKHQVAATASGREAFSRYAPFGFARYLDTKEKREGDYDLNQVHRFAVLIGAESRVSGAARIGDGNNLGTSKLRDLVIAHFDKAHPGEGFDCSQVFYRQDEKTLDFPKQHALELLFEVGRIAVTAEEIPLFANCIGLWKMNDDELNTTVLDFSGGDRHGVAELNTYTMSRVGKLNKCLEFNGVSDWITIPDDPAWDVGKQFSIAMWFRTANQELEHLMLIERCNCFNLEFIAFTSIDRLIFRVRTASGWKWAFLDVAKNSLRNNAWHFVVVTYNKTLSSNRLKLYMDNVLSAQAEGYAENVFSGSAVVSIGRHAVLEWSWDGFIDVTALFSRALSVDEIDLLWNNGSGTEDIIDG